MSAITTPNTTPKKLTAPTHARGRSASCSVRPAAFAFPVPSLQLPPAPTPAPLTPPPSRRSSATAALSKPLSLSVSQPEDESIHTPTTPIRPRTHSRTHQRSKSANLLPEDIPNLPGYAKPTQRSRSRSRATSLSTGNPSEGHTIVTRHGVTSLNKGSTTSTFKITSNSTNSHLLRIDTDKRFRLEVRIHAMNAIEVVAVPLQEEPAPGSPLVVFTPPCSPSVATMLEKDMLIPELLTIPALDIPSPVELDSTATGLIMVTPASAVGSEDEGDEAQETPTPPPPPPPPPQNEEEHLEAVTSFVEKRDLSRFFKSEKEDAGGMLEILSAKAAVLVKELQEDQNNDTDEEKPTSFIKDAATVADVVKVSLYDQIIFCDDSYSMQMYGLVPTLQTVLTSIAKVAIALTKTSDTTAPSGISLRFINHTRDTHMNNLASLTSISSALAQVPFDGDTKLGKQLKRKVLEPFLVDRLEGERRELEKPILVTIITDGEPQGEHRGELKRTILWCKEYMVERGYGPYAVGFHIAQIGESSAAQEFLREIETDPEVREHVYVSKGLMDGNVATEGAEWGRENALRWLGSLVKAIEH